ncbi:MAG: DUF2523 domain-containing protein [Betaproteobacteria bacterium]|nr:DUF2523 domain-containing protein [Betaproteobacteria bacterium]
MNIAVWLGSILPSLASRVLAALGFAVVQFTGIQAVGSMLASHVSASFGGIPSDILGLMNLAGLGTGMNILLGAITARLTLSYLSQATKIMGSSS